MNLFALLRLCILGTILLFSVIVMGLAANLTANTITLSFPGFAVAVSVLTIIALTPILVIDRLRKGSFLSWVVVEFGVSAVLWVLWLASASLTTSSGLFTGDCGIWISSRLESFCRQYSAVQAFSWLNWLLFKVYGILILVLAILAAMKGHKRVWFSPASDLSFSPTHTHSGEPKIPPPGAVPYQNTGGGPMPYNTTGGSYNAGPNPNPAYPGYVPQGQYAPPAGSPQPSYGAPYGSPVPPPPNPHASHV